LRHFFHSVGAPGASRYPPISNYFFPFMKSHTMTSPVNAVSNPVRQVRRPSQREPHYARVIVIETSIMRRHDGVVFRTHFNSFASSTPPGTTNTDTRSISGGLCLREDLVQRDEAVAA